MQEVVPYKNEESKKPEGMSLKEKIFYSLLTAGGLTTLFVFGKKFIEKQIANKSEAKSFEDGTPETIAKQIRMAFENDGQFGTDTDALRQILISIPSKTELNKIHKEYQKQNHSDMYKDMSGELQLTEYNEMLQIMAGKPDKKGQPPTLAQYQAWAKRLKAAFDKTYSFIPGTDEKAIKAVFAEIPSQAAFIVVGREYQKLYGVDILTALKSELEIWEYGDYMKIITSKPKV